MPGLGRIAVVDERDRKYSVARLLSATPETQRKTRYWYANGWWGDQGETPQCVGYAWCMTPENRTLTADLRWVALGDLKVGDRLIGFDEYPDAIRRGRFYKEAVVQGVKLEPRPVYEVELASGQTFRTTADHQWLTKRHWQWKTTEELRLPAGGRPGTKLPLLFDPWGDDDSWEAGWLAGLLDGEGTVGRYAHVSFGQRPGAVLDRALGILDRREKVYGTQHIPVAHHGLGRGDTIKVNINGGMKLTLRMLGMVRPVRLIDNLKIDELGRLEHRPEDAADAVVARRFVGVREIAMVQTSTRTMIVEGYPMHNCHWLEDGPVTQDGPIPIVHPEDVYRRAQAIDEWPGDAYDGTSIRAGAQTLRQQGLIDSFHWALGIDEVVDTLLRLGPVVLGTAWLSDMFEPNSRGVVSASGYPVGGHAYLANGVNTTRRVIRCKNSWGRGFADNGHFWLTFDDLAALLEHDGEACIAVEVRQ